jgi:hypothetical protein
MPSSTVIRHRPAARIGLVALVVALLTLLWAPAAGAAPALTIALDPPEVLVLPYPVENFGPLTLEDEDVPFTPVPVQWGGSVVLELPAALDGSAMEVYLGLAPTVDDPPSREYSTSTPAPDDLPVTPLGGGRFSVALPADDGVHGPFGYLLFDNITSALGGVYVLGVDYVLEFDPGAGASEPLAPELLAVTTVPCAMSSLARCPAYEITAGEQFALTVPPSSTLRGLGLGSLDTLQLVLDPLDAEGYPTGEDFIELTRAAQAAAAGRPPGPPVPGSGTDMASVAEAALAQAASPPGPGVVDLTASGVVAASGAYSATATVPGGVRGGPYMLSVIEVRASGGLSLIMLELDVEGRPQTNAGLRSDTGWDEPQAAGPAPGPQLAVLGGSLMLVAGLGTVALVQGRRTRAPGE